MLIAMIVVGVLVGLMAVIILVGKMLPVAHTARARAVLHRPSTEVWSTLTDFGSYSGWRRGIARVDAVGSGATLWRELDKKGEGMTYETLESSPNQRLVRRITDKNLPFGGTWTFALEEKGNDTVVSIREDGEVYNPVFRFVSRFLMGHHATMTAFLEDLGKKYGENVQVQKD